MFVSAILEMVGIGSIPVFINLLLDSEKLYNFIPSDKLINFLLYNLNSYNFNKIFPKMVHRKKILNTDTE